MKLAFTVGILAGTVIPIKSCTNQMPICGKLNVVENYLRELESNGIPFSKIPHEKLLRIKSLIKDGEKAGCKKQSKISTSKPCKRFFQKSKSVICE